MKVYEVHFDNGESYEDYSHSLEAIFASKELAEQYACLLYTSPSPRD